MMKIKSIILMLLCATCAFAAKVDKNMTITVDGISRSYYLYVPNNVKDNAPLVVVLHGSNGHSYDKQLRFTTVADKEGCIVLFPQGRVIPFPIGFGGSTTGWESTGEFNTDVNFIRSMVAKTESEYSIDAKRVYCCGFSNGGMMTYQLTQTCSDIFAAFASISGYPINEFHFRHTGERPVPFLHIHGKNDGFVLYSLVPTIVDEMVARLGANPVPVKTRGNGYDKSVYAATEGSFPYTYYEIDGMGHEDFTSKTPDGSSAQTMWNFFKQYTLDTPCDKTLKWMPRIDEEGFEPTKHGVKYVNTSAYALQFGTEHWDNSNSNHNVYHSLQLAKGNYKLCFKAEGKEGVNLKVSIKGFAKDKDATASKAILPTTVVPVGEDVVIPITVTDEWIQCTLNILRTSVAAPVILKNLAIYSVTDEELETITAIHEAQAREELPVTAIYNTAGVAVKNYQSGVNIVKFANGETKKLMKD